MRYIKPSIALLLVFFSAVSAKEEKQLYPSGALHFVYSKTEDGKLDGTSKELYENGNMKNEFVYELEKLVFEKRYRSDGKIEYEFQLKDGKKHEILRGFHPNGALFRERLLINGIQEGVERDFYPDGKLKAERTYKNGKKEGSAKGYFQNGKVQGDWVFENGVPVAAIIFYMTGEKHLVHGFSEGKIHGITKEYEKMEN